VRDLDVLLLRLRGEIDGLPERERAAGAVLVEVLETERAQARAALLEVLDAPRYPALLERLADAVRYPLPTPAAPPRADLLDLPRTELRKLRRDVRRAGAEPADEVLHALRIRVKRVRYTGELVAPALRGTPAGRRVKGLVTAAAALQEVLGDHQDACVAEQRIRELLDGLGEVIDAHVVFAAGRLVERERSRADAKRDEWQAAWAALDAAG
jgi:CHAD domain-containing protein